MDLLPGSASNIDLIDGMPSETMTLNPHPEPEPELGCFCQTCMIPWHLYDYIPLKAASAMGQYQLLKPPTPPLKQHKKSPSPMPEPLPSPEPLKYFDTIPNDFGVFKRYKNSIPSTYPDDTTNLDSIADAPTFAIPSNPCT